MAHRSRRSNRGKALAPLAHTYSIVARDPESGELGVAVQSHYFDTGSVVPGAEPGVGAVATQAFVEISYGPRGLDLMRGGKSAPEALRELLPQDAGREFRQVAMIDSSGRVAAHTGARTIAYASHVVGENFSVQANMMLTDTVPAGMAKTFSEAKGDLAERLLAALDAAEDAGGDIRGRQSAALVVVEGSKAISRWAKLFDVRVDDHPEPLRELRRLVQLKRAYNHNGAGDLALRRGEFDKAFAEYARSSELAPDNIELAYWRGLALADAGKIDDGIGILREVFAKDRRWIELTKRLPAVRFGVNDSALIDRILKEAMPK
jgi:uncharacterized Ntn-hydrolase superfamily protein